MAAINGQFDMAMFLIERGANPNLVAGRQRRDAAVGRRQHAVAAAHPLSAAAGDGAAEGDLSRRDEGAARRRRRIPTRARETHPWYLVYSGCGNRNCGLADTCRIDGVLARGAYATDVDAMRLLIELRRRSQHPDRRAAGRRSAAAPLDAPPPGAGWSEPRRRRPRTSRSFDAPPIPPGGPGAFSIHAAAGVESRRRLRRQRASPRAGRLDAVDRATSSRSSAPT